MKRISLLLLIFCIFLSGCGIKPQKNKISVVCTNFPVYDFTRAVAGDKADITLLIKPGLEVHTYDPSPSDIFAVNNADLFIYVGGESDEWVKGILSASKVKPLALIDYVDTLNEDGEDEIDEHIWTSPLNAKLMIDKIAKELASADKKNESTYHLNALEYKSKIDAADLKIKSVINSKSEKSVLVADRFPLKYFTEYYGLSYTAALGGCAESSEVSLSKMIDLAETVKEKKYKYIFCTELSSKSVAKALSEQTGTDILEISSAHNVTKDDFNNNITYVDIMNKNALALERGMS
ncbi:MAG: metal ABC transporter substrate-binding protein [Clostridia bacterium]|nr:metal ABC transporter substrate-binding protein [Clostridia bacterium]